VYHVYLHFFSSRPDSLEYHHNIPRPATAAVVVIIIAILPECPLAARTAATTIGGKTTKDGAVLRIK
jgi:hypothetical protein